MTSAARRPGDGPRKAAHIFDTTLRLLAAHGYDGLTVEGIAAASGVNKTTLYRWWDTKDALLADALDRSALFRFTPPDTGSLRGDLTALTGYVRGLLTGPDSAGAVAAAFAAAASRPGLTHLVRNLLADRLDREQSIFDRAVARGEITADLDRTAVVDMLLGAVWLRVMFRGGDTDAHFDETVVGLLVDGLPTP
ncbi:TetR family transcriptional regulator [Stackebrandtia albiflava]|uniref:TetR family transcriptional regulator n=1 Tax=Stackebrandtia albiflava TaxID=406432 RepID=A0A562V1G2_9ACTN|nr:TetR/AcrR family transcriptional regulator [Stackebrandtia albiflava]TWJ11685.1 TetR family transcriptional regulator [Stackebrandtia albiflava]